MATKLFGIKIGATTDTTTTITTNVKKYFYEVPASHGGAAELTIASTDFFDEDGAAVVGNLPVVSGDSGYYLLTINGQLQQTSLYTVDSGGASVVISQASTLTESTPITLVISDFTASSTSTTTTTV